LFGDLRDVWQRYERVASAEIADKLLREVAPAKNATTTGEFTALTDRRPCDATDSCPIRL
jgi:hypothetical protein